jgi:hypothetical protein
MTENRDTKLSINHESLHLRNSVHFIVGLNPASHCTRVEDSPRPELLMQIKLTFLNLAVAAHIAPVIKKRYGSAENTALSMHLHRSELRGDRKEKSNHLLTSSKAATQRLPDGPRSKNNGFCREDPKLRASDRLEGRCHPPPCCKARPSGQPG